MILNDNLQRVLANLNEHNDVFSRLAIRPSTNYPGRTQEALLTQLLRKKKEPNVDEAAEEAKLYAEAVGQEGLDKMLDIWSEVYKWLAPRVSQYIREEMRDPYTKKEREMGIENVRTGLKRDIEKEYNEEEEEDDDDQEESEEEEEEDAQPDTRPAEPQANDAPVTRGPELEQLLWFMTRGDFDLPENIEYHRKDRQPYRGMQGFNIPPQTRPEDIPTQEAPTQGAMEGVTQT